MKKGRAKKKTKITTIEGLAIAVHEGFEAMHARFDSFEKSVNVRFDKIEKHLAEADKRIAALEMKVAGIYRMLEEDKMQRPDINHLFARLAKLEKEVFGK